jgi:hypothetical protein
MINTISTMNLAEVILLFLGIVTMAGLISYQLTKGQPALKDMVVEEQPDIKQDEDNTHPQSSVINERASDVKEDKST